jgi:hypothetical protein
VEDIIALEDGRFVHPRSVWSIFKSEPRVVQYQLVQQSQRRFELRLVTPNQRIFEQISPRIVEALKTLVGDGVTIECKFAQGLSRETSGKFRPVKALNWRERPF